MDFQPTYLTFSYYSQSCPLKFRTQYDLRPAFGEYFIRTYGEETFLNSMLAPSRVKEYTGKTMNQIVDDWCVDMDNPEND